MQFRFYLIFLLSGFMLLGQFSCKPKKLEGGKEIANEVERRTVKRITDQQILTEAMRIGDSLVQTADTLLQSKLQESFKDDGIAKALQHYPPEKYPEIQEMAQQYGAKPQRQVPRSASPTTSQAQRLNQREVVYTAPIYAKASCLKCHGRESIDISAADYAVLRSKFPDFKLTGRKNGDLLGMWYIPMQRQKILESLTLKRGKDQRIRNLFK